MSTINSQDWQRDPEALLRRVAAGERIVVLREGQPIAELRPITPEATTQEALEPRPYGLCQGVFVTPDEFADPLPDGVLREFQGG